MIQARKNQAPVLAIERAEHPTIEVRDLLSALDAELLPLYDPDQHHGLALDEIFRPEVHFFVARMEGEAVGCGGFALFDGDAEVKRMYVIETARGRGIAGAVLARIEEEARATGATLLRLETGDLQHAAIALYRRAGFEKCAPFGPYRDKPEASIAASLFFEKRLNAE